MGTYCSLILADYEIDSSKSSINPFWACLFNEDDRRSRLVHPSKYYPEPITDNDLVPTYEYAIPGKILKQRLEILGFTLDKVKSGFNEGILNSINLRRDYYPEEDNSEMVYLNKLKEGGFEQWKNHIKHIIQNKLYQYNLDTIQATEKEYIYPFILDYDDIHEDLFMGYPTIGFGYLLRGMLEVVNADDELILDITSLIHAGYYSIDEPVCANTAAAQLNSKLIFQKIIILTEGKSDTFILSESLKLLFPKLEGYFSFLDFASTKAEGSSSALEKTVKAFAAAGINNKIIALFDNDAAGVASSRRLKTLKLGSNIKVLTLPEISIGNNYPTTGPLGPSNENINGRACSIEMYLGEDTLKGPNGFIPVYWRGKEEQLSVNQGEIESKGKLQKKFEKKLSLAKNDDQYLSNDDWSGLKLIFEMIFKEVSLMEGL